MTLNIFGRGFLPGCMHLVAEGKVSLGVGGSVELLTLELLFLVLLPVVLSFGVVGRMELLASVSVRIQESTYL